MSLVELGAIGQISGAPIEALAGITDLMVYQTAGGAVLLSVTRGGGWLVSYNLGGAPGGAHVSQSWQIASSLTQLESTDLAILDAGVPSLLMAGFNSTPLLGRALGTVAPGAALGGAQSFQVTGASAASFTDIATFEGHNTGIVAVRGGGLQGFQISGGVMSIAPLNYGQTLQAAPVSDLVTGHVGGRDLALASFWSENAVALFELGGNGSVSHLNSLIAGAESTWISLPMAGALVDVAGQAYALVAAAGSNSLTVLEIAQDGGMQVVDHVLDTLETRFADVTVFDVAEVNGLDIVVAAGSDDGLSAFVLLPGGRLHLLATIEGSAETPLRGITEIALAVTPGGIRIFVATQSAPFLTEMSLTLPNPGDMLVAGGNGDTLNGTSGDDVLAGAAGADRIDGRGGDDILVDGAGSDTLIGGAGSDDFLFSPDGAIDVIVDFQPGTDRIDLTALGVQWDFSDLVMINRDWGVELRYGDEVIELRTAGLTAASLSAADFIAFGHATYAGEALDLPPGHQRGSPGADQLIGDDEANQITGLAGDDRIVAMGGNDTIFGGAGFDLIEGNEGFDSINGGTGNDTIDGGAGFDTIDGGSGDDSIDAGAGHDRLLGGDGADRLRGGLGFDTILGGLGNDLMIGGNGSDRLRGGAGFDTLEGGRGNDWMIGEGGFDEIAGGAGNDTIDGGAGNDLLIGGGGADSILGGFGFDTILAGNGNDWLKGENGKDTLGGGLGNDTVDGGNGNDSVAGGAGFDLLRGGAGDDTVDGGAGNDLLYGGTGADSILGGAGHDTIQAGPGRDWMMGGLGDDRLRGGGGNDTMNGGLGGDWMAGEYGYDVMTGGGGNDTLSGGGGNDQLVGGAGADWLEGGTGNDRLTGGLNADRFVFADGHGDDTITDFDPLNDNEKIDLSAVSAITGAADLNLESATQGAATQAGANVVIDTGDGNSIILLNVDLSDLGAVDFVF